jgi:hypothetical protein
LELISNKAEICNVENNYNKTLTSPKLAAFKTIFSAVVCMAKPANNFK